MEGARPAIAGDLDRIAQLARALHTELADMRGGEIWQLFEARREPFADAYGALLDRSDAHLVVGMIDDVVVGFAAGEVATLLDGRCLGRTTDLFVETEAREVGVAEAMLTDLLAFFGNQGCFAVDALALPGHRAAKNFFEEQGFTARLIVMHHRLQP